MQKFLPLLFSFLILGGSLFGQTVILDFEEAATTTNFTYFGSTLDGSNADVAANPFPGGINASDSVLVYVKPSDAQTWAGAFSNPDPQTPIDATNGGQFCVDVYYTQPGNLALKLENSTTGGDNWILTQDVTTTGEWTQVCFDLTLPSEEAPSTAAAGHTYTRIVIFPDFGSSPDMDLTYYLDNFLVQEGMAMDVDVQFSVDMNEYDQAFTTVYVSGTFNDWSADSNPLSDPDGDGIWTATYPIPAGPIEWKYQVDGWADQEEFAGGEDCTRTTDGFTNRFKVITGPAELDTVCWASCYACGEEITITINVGTSHIDVNPDGIYLAGGGVFGVPGDNPLNDDDGDGVYTITLVKNRGFSSYYTFTNGACADWSCKENIAGQDCARPENFNDRWMGPITQDTVINTCFAQCTDDLECGGGLADGEVTFQVDMSEFEGDFQTVYLSGSFNSWSGDANPMDDSDGDNIWTITVPLGGGEYEYKFSLDNWTDSETLTDGDSCTITDPSGQFVNRVITVDGDATLDAVCFGFCASCDVVSTIEIGSEEVEFRIMPTVSSHFITAGTGGFILPANSRMLLLDATGRPLQQFDMSGRSQRQIDVSTLPRGLYFLQLTAGNARTVERFIKQ